MNVTVAAFVTVGVVDALQVVQVPHHHQTQTEGLGIVGEGSGGAEGGGLEGDLQLYVDGGQ